MEIAPITTCFIDDRQLESSARLSYGRLFLEEARATAKYWGFEQPMTNRGYMLASLENNLMASFSTRTRHATFLWFLPSPKGECVGKQYWKPWPIPG